MVDGYWTETGLGKSFVDIKSHENINFIREKQSMYCIKENCNFKNFKQLI